MAIRLLVETSDLGASTTTSSTPVDKVTNTVTVVSGRSYALFWSFQPSSNDTSSVITVRLRDSTGGVELGFIRWASKDTTDLPIQGGVGVFTAASSGSRTFSIDYARFSGTGTMSIAGARLIVLELGANDGFVSAPGQISTSSTSFIDAATASWTAVAGDYLFLAQASLGNNGTEAQLLTPGGTSVNPQNGTQLNGTSFGGWAAAWVETLGAGSAQAKVQYRSNTGSGVNLRGMAVVAISLADIRAAQHAQTQTPSTGTQTSYQTALTLSATGLDPVSRPTLVIASASIRGNETNNSAYQQIREDGTQIVEGLIEPRGSTTVNTASSIFAKIVTANDNAIDYDIRRRSSNSALTSTVPFAHLSVIELSTLVDISGAAAGQATVAGILRGRGDVSGASAGVAAVAGILRGLGRLSGAAAGLSTATADIEGLTALSGAAAGLATVVGDLLGRGDIAGSAAGAATVSGDLVGRGDLSGAAAGAATATADIYGQGDISGSAAGEGDLQGNLQGEGALAGAAAGQAQVDGNLVGQGDLAGAAAGSSTASGGLASSSAISGSAAGTSSADGDLQGDGALAGLAQGLASASASLVGEGALAGQADGAATVTGDLRDAAGLSGTADGTSTATGNLEGLQTLGEMVAAWSMRTQWQPPGAAEVLGHMRGAAAGSSNATAGLKGRYSSPAERPRAAPKPAPYWRPRIQRVPTTPTPILLSAAGRAAGSSGVAGGLYGRGPVSGVSTPATKTRVSGTLVAEGALGGHISAAAASTAVLIGPYSDTPDDEEAILALLAAA